ncbi:DUF5710 domain-containing protein [Nostoc sp. CHAB 5834]|nr:DUF5710 domain-containing protein [Nostoc sp. CHAB 5834]
MHIPLGEDFFKARTGASPPVLMDTKQLINPHLLVLGTSGSGKSSTFKRFINAGIRSSKKVRFHVFDVHGDLDIPDASVAVFSEHAPFGLNPLRVNPSPLFGGVRKCIQTFIRIVNESSKTALGVKQESVLRNLLEDVYRDFGFEINDPSTWTLNIFDTQLLSSGSDNRLYLEVPIADKEEAKALGARWDGDKKHWWIQAHKYEGAVKKWSPAYRERTYPSIRDVVAYARRIHEERFLGTDQKGVKALGELNKAARSHQRKVLESLKARAHNVASSDTEMSVDQARNDAIDAFVQYAKAVKTGYELESLMKYDSPEVLKGVLDRLLNILATGVLKPHAPPFDPDAQVWRYKLNALLMEEKKMLVLFMLTDIFYKAIERGEQSEVVEVIVLDELGTYISNSDVNGDGIIGIIATQARKYGLALWAANQSTENVPTQMMSSMGTKVVLGLDETFWKTSASKLLMEMKLLEWIQPTKTMAVQMKERSSNKTRWRWIMVPQIS